MKLFRPVAAVAAAALTLAALPAAADVTLPPSGGNQKATVIQHMGLVTIQVDYSSPNVHGPSHKDDRRGKIWGGLVPYGLHDLEWNDCKQCPWRAGANENTVLTVSHDVKVEGKPLPAGAYGLHMLAGKDAFTVIFSKRSHDWGSYWYDPKEDALRVDVKPSASEYHEFLTYDFDVRELGKSVLALKWEDLKVPLTITVDEPLQLYVKNLREELHGGASWDSEALEAAARFTLENKIALDEGLSWAERSVKPTLGGRETVQTLGTLGLLQAELGKPEAVTTIQKAAALASQPGDAYRLGRQLLTMKKPADALTVFSGADKRWPGAWPLDVGFARVYAAQGQKAKALEYARKALPKAPNEPNKKNLESIIKKIEAGQALE